MWNWPNHPKFVTHVISRFFLHALCDTVNGLFCAMHVTYCLRYVCDVFSTLSGGYRKPMRTCSRKRIIVYRKYVMFIKQSTTRFTMVTKDDTKTGH